MTLPLAGAGRVTMGGASSPPKKGNVGRKAAGADRARVGHYLVEPGSQIVVAVRAAHVEAGVRIVDRPVQRALCALSAVHVDPHGPPS